jgi:hypothetical protein
VRRALLVAINTYLPAGAEAATPAESPGITTHAHKRAGFSNLDGALNDLEGMRGLLVSRYGFKPENIHVLRDGQASRQAILDAVKQYLVDEPRSGDDVLFFYAGHGSQVRNSLSREPDKLDETLVPADARKGVADIRDKEVGRLVNAALDKNVRLTMIVDSCHSGSIARGYEKVRELPPADGDVKDPSVLEPPPETRAVVMSAAQDFQTAAEVSEPDGPHGLFSAALIRTLATAQPTEPLERLFRRVTAIMQSTGRMQAPVLAGPRERLRQPLFGTSGVSRGTVMAALRIGTDSVVLQGGSAIGLRPGCELSRVDDGATPVRLTVTRVTAPTTAEAAVTAGGLGSVKSGDLFQVVRWAADARSLKVFWPAPLPTMEALVATVGALDVVRGDPRVRWVEDPVATPPSHVLLWADGQWQLDGAPVRFPLGERLEGARLRDALRSSTTPVSFYAQLPPPAEVVSELKHLIGPGTPNEAIAFAASSGEAHYLLVSRVDGQGVSVAWARPAPGALRVPAGGAPAPPTPLPTRTDWVPSGPRSAPAGAAAPASAEVARRLEEQASRLNRVLGWLTLEPGDDGPDRFPYHLVLRDAVTGRDATGDELALGETLDLVLRADPAPQAPVLPRWVYVLDVSSDGSGTLLFPDPRFGNVENKLPAAGAPPAEIPLPHGRIKVTTPGVDVLVMIAADVPPQGSGAIDLDVFTWDPVRTRGAAVRVRADASPLTRLLASVGGMRGISPEAPPVNWSIERRTFRIVEGR